MRLLDWMLSSALWKLIINLDCCNKFMQKIDEITLPVYVLCI